MSRILFDLEANGFLPDVTKIHCVATVDVDAEERRFFGPHEVTDALEYLAGHTLIAHNGVGYDFPVLKKLHGFNLPAERQLDTLVLARLIHPDVRDKDKALNKTRFDNGEAPLGAETGRHSLRAWGKRLRIPKADFEGPWDGYTEQMGDYCRQDIETTLRLWRYLDPDHYSQTAIELEHDVARLCDMITQAGWPFNETAAHGRMSEWTGKKEALEEALIEEFKGWEETEIFIPKVNNKARGYVKNTPFEKKWFITFNPQSRDHIIRALQDRGWKPAAYTDGGKPKLDEEVIEGLAASFQGCSQLVDYLTICKRLGQLATGEQAWLKNVRNGRIHASYNPMGAVTSRAAHYNPNIAQVPKNSSPYGHECRSLFTVPPGYVQLGADMAGLELRCFAHYLAKYDDSYGKLLLTGDPHWEVVKALRYAEGERDKDDPFHALVRDRAKTSMYAMLYGCGDRKMGLNVLETCRAAAKLSCSSLYAKFFGPCLSPSDKTLKAIGANSKHRLITGIPGFEELKRDIARILDTKSTLPGLDKRRLPVRSEHAALNTLLQSAGAILCKRWIAQSYKDLEYCGYQWGHDYWFLGWIHDELQIAVKTGAEQCVGVIVTDAAKKAGEPYGFRIPLDSEFKIGSSWASTH